MATGRAGMCLCQTHRCIITCPVQFQNLHNACMAYLCLPHSHYRRLPQSLPVAVAVQHCLSSWELLCWICGWPSAAASAPAAEHHGMMTHLLLLLVHRALPTLLQSWRLPSSCMARWLTVSILGYVTHCVPSLYSKSQLSLSLALCCKGMQPWSQLMRHYHLPGSLRAVRLPLEAVHVCCCHAGMYLEVDDVLLGPDKALATGHLVSSTPGRCNANPTIQCRAHTVILHILARYRPCISDIRLRQHAGCHKFMTLQACQSAGPCPQIFWLF